MTLLFSSISLISLIASFIALVLTIVLLLKTKRTTQRLEKLMANMGGESIEDTLLDHYDRFKKFEKVFRTLITRHKETATTARESIHNVGMVRFNPFQGEIGGDQSFSIALLDGSHTGIVITALHSREGTRIYAKPVVRGLSDYSLSREEQLAIEKSLTNK